MTAELVAVSRPQIATERRDVAPMWRAFLAFAFLVIASANAEAAPCAAQSFEGDSFTICAFSPKRETLHLATTDESGTPLRGFDALATALKSDAKRVRFAMNAGMFDDTGNAIGLLIEDGTLIHKLNTAKGSGNFHLMPNGVFSQDTDGALHVETAKMIAARKPNPRWATQSGPMLVIGGKLHPQFSEDGPSRYIRNGVGVAGRHEAYFAISEAPVSFGKFARLFRDALHCPDALYFDGSVSSLWDPATGRKDASRLLGPMVVVLER